jgi:hypothetical protein
MRILAIARYALCFGLANIVLGGCGGGSSAVGTMPQVDRPSPASATQILYAYGDYVEMLSYPGLKTIGKLSSPSYALVLDCADDVTGNVYFLGFKDNYRPPLISYPIGGTQSNGMIAPPENAYFNACAADPTTGNLAVLAFTVISGEQFYVAVYPPGSGLPQEYTDPNLTGLYSLAYDSQGNLFVEGTTPDNKWGLAELSKGGSQFVELSISGGKLRGGGLEWDGTDLALRLSSREHRRRRVAPPMIQRISISGSSARIIGTTKLERAYLGDWIQSDTVISGVFRAKNEGKIALYHYPAGGEPYNISRGFDEEVTNFLVATEHT